MEKRIFTEEQIEEMLKNENVSKCSDKSITYKTEFKAKALEEYNNKGLTAREIFKQAGFDIDIIGRKTPKECIRRWNKVFRAKGAEALFTDSRGGNRRKNRERPKDKSDEDKIKRLELEVEYLKAENDFLAKLRAKRKHG